MESQITNTLLMIQPVNFRYNSLTAADNYYQVNDPKLALDSQQRALAEFDDFVLKLRNNGIRVIVVKDSFEPDTPDSIFPNNWVSFHADGTVVQYPMKHLNRRLERRPDIVDKLKTEGFEINAELDLTHYESNSIFLEGTGSMILDRENKLAYACISERTNAAVLQDFCRQMNYEAVVFTANQTVDNVRQPIYHTNVVMCVGIDFVAIGLDAIDNEQEKQYVVEKILATKKRIIALSEAQLSKFCGNMLQLQQINGRSLIVLSQTAYLALTPSQQQDLSLSGELLYSDLHTIETCGGGSARCMMAEVFLPKTKV